MLVANQFLNKILQTKDFEVVKSNGLDETYFKGYENEFNFISEHYKKYGNIPDTITFLNKFPDFELQEVNETNDYLLDRLYEEFTYNNFCEQLPPITKLLKEDSRKAFEYLTEVMPKLKPHTVCRGIDIIQQGLERYELFKNRTQNGDALVIKTGLQELDEIFGGWEMGEELVTIVARTNQGKCFCSNTLILMADGTYKKVQDIEVGDRVQSYGRINTVTGLHKGISKGYRIIPKSGGESFIITDGHILTLWDTNQTCSYIKNPTVADDPGVLIDITIEDYLSKPKYLRDNYRLFRPAVEYPTKDLKIEPYILGTWLGEDENLNTITINDVKEETPSINILSSDLQTYNLANNKHIPLIYLTADRNQRLQLLAGIIDIQGSYNESLSMYEVVIKSDDMAKQFCQLIRGLGFEVNLTKKFIKEIQKEYNYISILGNLSLIPCKIKSIKDTISKIKERNSQLTDFTVERIEKEFEYYGFECDGDHRFLLGDNTLTHNSWLLMKFLAEAWKQGKRVGLYSGEMSHIKLGYRFDALFNHFSNRALVQGAQTEGYKEYMENLVKIQNPFTIITQNEFSGRPTVSKIRNFIEENNIEIMGIDQYSLMDDGRATMRDPTRIRLSHISEDLFSLSSEYKIPILGLAQSNREGANKDDQTQAPGLENIKESDDIAHNSSKCIGMRQSSFGLVLDIIKNREGKVGDKLLYSWDIDTGWFSFIPSADDAARPETRQKFANQDKMSFQPSSASNPF